MRYTLTATMITKNVPYVTIYQMDIIITPELINFVFFHKKTQIIFQLDLLYSFCTFFGKISGTVKKLGVPYVTMV